MPIRRDHMWFCIYFIYLYTCLYQCNGQELSCDQLRNPVKIVGSQAFIEVDGNRSVLFPWNGIGYSPVPNSDDLAAAPYGDYFQSAYSALWQERDFPLMQNMNVSVVRIWSWNFISNHKLFLDTLYNSGCRPLRLMLPFLMTTQLYPSLVYPDVRTQVLTDYEAFLDRHSAHPAILAYMIGNELNKEFNEELDYLFSILKDMISVRNQKGITIPITLPLAGDPTFEILVDTYYDTVDLDFWSVQVYDTGRLEEVITYYRNRTAHNPKPLLISEFGVDAFGSLRFSELSGVPVVNESLQAKGLDDMWQIIHANSDIVLGGAVMEFADEWWKGDFPFTSNPEESCPNLNYDAHNYCGNIIGNVSFLNEEWLGVFAQLPSTYFMSVYTHCIEPRQAFYTLRGWWSNSTAELPPGPYCAQLGLFGAMYYFIAAFIYLLFLAAIVEISFYCCKPKPPPESTKMILDQVAKQKSEEEFSAYGRDVIHPKRMSRLLSEIIKGKVYKYTDDLDAFEVVHMRVKALIWDKISSSKEFVYSQVHRDTSDEEEGEEVEEELSEDTSYQVHMIEELREVEKRIFVKGITEVYHKYMEAYRIWKKTVIGKAPKPEPTVDIFTKCRKRLDDVILWNVVHQTAGTISHAPEKVCQVYYFVKKFLKMKRKDKPPLTEKYIELMQTKEAREDLDVHGQALVQSLLCIFKRYYDDAFSKHINYDDLNSDGQNSIIKKVDWTSVAGMNTLEEAYVSSIHPNKWKEEQAELEKAKQKGDDLEKGKGPEIPDGADVLAMSDMDKEAAKEKFKTRRQRTFALESGEIPVFKIVHEANSIRIISSPSQVSLDDKSGILGDVSRLPPIKKIQEKHTTVKKYFPNLGGVLGCIVCFSWLLRINVWSILLAQYCALPDNDNYLAEGGTCRAVGFPLLALTDAALASAANILRFFVAGVGNFTILNYVKLVYFIAWFFFIIAYQLLPMLSSLEILIMAYLGLVVVLGLIEEFYLNAAQCALPIPGRDDRYRTKSFVNVGFWLGNLAMAIVFGLWLVGMIPQFLSSDVVFFTSIFGVKSYLFLVVCAVLAPFAGYGLGIGLGMARANALSRDDVRKRLWLKKQVYADARYLFRTLLFWLSTFGIQWIFLEHILIPSVENVTGSVCACESARLQTTPNLADYCDPTRRLMCWGALVMMWISTVLISYVSIFSSFNIVLLVAGTYSAVQSRVGNVKTWGEVERYFYKIMSKNMVAISLVFEKKFFQFNFWNDFIDSMYSEHLLSKSERELLKYSKNGKKKPCFRPAPYSKEAQRRIIKFLWSLEAMLNTKGKWMPNFRKRYMVRTMPSWTIMVPCHSETCVYLQEDLIRPQKGAPRISTIEYLAATYPEEWRNLCHELRPEPNGPSPNDVLDDFLNTPVLKPDEKLEPEKGQCSSLEIDHICFWASYRGQTLVRTVKGLFNYRIALEKLAMAEEGVWFMSNSSERSAKIKEIQKMVRKKFQIIIAYQIYQPNVGGLWTKERDISFKKMLTRFHDFDLVYNGADDRHSIMTRFLKGGEKTHVQIIRPGPLLIGEPKAENQHHALAFATGSVLQVNDMNMYTSLENAYKMPFMLNQFFNTPEDWSDPAMLIPQFRIIGYPEHTYTKKLSTVGDLMGSAEYCFVTIMQRVLGFLRVRAHYGHPDFLDGYWVRTRGGVSKASHLINTNEDIFSGYEIIGRGERIKYIEYIEQEKGRESSFDNAFIFEAKLAKGAAQQIKSPHIYILNERLPLLVRLSLFFGSIGFYISTMLMSMTIDLYIFTILLYIASGVDYHALGLLDAVIAVPWILQIGYIQALPLLLELSIEQGIWEGLALFLKRLLIGIIFFVFHVRTKSYYFAQGLLSGKGGYMGTGRGFGLDRRSLVDLYKLYFDSHFNNALILFVACMAYCVVSTDSASEIALRLASIILVVFSWLVAPVLFNPYPTREGQQNDFDAMLEWIRTPVDLKLDNRLHDEIANGTSENDRKKVIAKWWSSKELSYTAYVIKSVIDEWQAEDHLFKGFVDRAMLYIQKLIYFAWRFGPWILLCLPLYHYESLYYLFYVIVCLGVVGYIKKRHGERHEYFNAIQLAMLLIIAPLVTVLVNSQMTLAELVVSMILYLIIFYAIVSEISLGFINNILVKKFRSIEGSQLFPKRIRIPQFFFSFNSIWPAICLMFLATINTVCVILGNLLTTLLYNGAVADKWTRSYLQIKAQFIDKSIIMQAAKDAARLSTMNDLTISGSASSSEEPSGRDRSGTEEDFFNLNERIQSEVDDVRSEVIDHVDQIDQKLAAMRDLMTKNFDTLKKHILSLPLTGSPMQVTGFELGMTYAELKKQLDEKGKQLLNSQLSDREREAANIELEKLFVLLESTPEYKAEEAEKAEEKRRINEPIDKKALEQMRQKYSEGSLINSPDSRNRFANIPALKLLLSDKAEIVKKHANDWKFITINELTAEEMRAIRANLPNFGRHQIRQLAWAKGLENRIDMVESGAEKVQSIPKAGPARLDSPTGLKDSQFKLGASMGSPDPRKLKASPVPPSTRPSNLLSEINNRGFKLKKVSFQQN